MIHKKSVLFFALSVLLFVPFVLGEVSSSDKVEIQSQIIKIVDSVNNNNISSISSVVSPNARPGLMSEIETRLAGKMIGFKQSVNSFSSLEDDKVRVKGRFSASGVGWEVNGLSNSYMFENLDGSWLLVDTDFHERIDGKHLLKIVGKVFLIVLPFLLIFSAFWIWMLIDCARRTFNDKLVWLLIIVFLGFLGAILYFFIIRRNLVRKKESKKNDD